MRGCARVVRCMADLSDLVFIYFWSDRVLRGVGGASSVRHEEFVVTPIIFTPIILFFFSFSYDKKSYSH
jgi:hypothetical protein